MRTVAFILLLSVAANLGLAFVLWKRPGHAATAAASTSANGESRRRPNNPATPASEPGAIALDPAFRQAVVSRDPARLLQALRQADFPENYVRDILMWQLGDSLSEERLALLRADAEVPFWKLGSDPGRAERQRILREMDRAVQATARDLFGDRVPAHPLAADLSRQRYGFLPADKAEAAARIDADYAELAGDLRRETPGRPDPSVLRVLDTERRADLAAALSPPEMELYDLHLSSSADSLRRQLRLFQPTEEEFRAMLAVRRAQDEKAGNVSIPGAVTITYSSNSPEAREEYRKALSPERFAEFERAQDMGYQAARQIAAHFQLAPTVAEQTYEWQKTYQARIQAARTTPGVPAADRTAAVRQLATQAEADLARLLGAPGAEAYLKTAGFWLRPPEGGLTPAVRLPGG